jgi:hypothetical protein
MEYNVGQILYMTNSKNLKIIPIQVVEEVTKVTLTGTEKTYIIQFPDSKKTKVDIATLNGEFNCDVDVLRLKMIENATCSIDKMINIAQELAVEEYKLEKNTIQKNNDVQVETNDNIIMVDLGNGVKAKMKTNELKKVTNQ